MCINGHQNTSMQKKIEQIIENNGLLDKKTGPVIVGVSGGADSVALLNILHNAGFDCIVAHCNFMLRKEESLRDEEFVRTLCNKLQVRLYVTQFETVKYSKEHGISIEMSARNLRYEWFENLLKKHHAQAIAVGHHADDNIETVLMNLVRGTGLKGLGGMSLRNGNIIRPFLGTSRNEILNYLKKEQLNYVDDSSNLSNIYTRNFFRNLLIPEFEIINPSFRTTMTDTIELLSESYKIYHQSVSEISNRIVQQENNCIRIDINQLLREESPKTILFEILNEYQFNADQIHQIINSIKQTPGKLFYAPQWQLLKDRNYLILQKKIKIQEFKILLDINSEIDSPIPLKISQIQPFDFELNKSEQIANLDADKLKFPLTLRNYQNGDYFYPLGMKGKKKLSDYLTDIKLNRFEKEKVMVITSEDEIVWVVGFRIDERFKVNKQTKKIIQILIN